MMYNHKLDLELNGKKYSKGYTKKCVNLLKPVIIILNNTTFHYYFILNRTNVFTLTIIKKKKLLNSYYISHFNFIFSHVLSFYLCCIIT